MTQENNIVIPEVEEAINEFLEGPFKSYAQHMDGMEGTDLEDSGITLRTSAGTWSGSTRTRASADPLPF